MGDITAATKKVCTKRVNESGKQMNPHVDALLVSDDGVAVPPVSVQDPMVPITPRSTYECVDHLDLDDSPSPLKLPDFPNQELLDCDYKCKGGSSFKRERDSPSLFSTPNQQSLLSDCQLKDGVFSEDHPCTPKKNVFDPFAPGPDSLNLAPYCRKYTKKSKISVVRKLKFDMCTKFAPNSEDMAVFEEEILFQSVYSNILEVIIASQAKERGKVSCELPLSDGCRTPIVATKENGMVSCEFPLPDGCQTPVAVNKENEMVSCELPLSDECRTPIAVTRLSGVADICPGAPVKGSHRFRRIDKGKCRKLEF